jgi:hypothetical protein
MATRAPDSKATLFCPECHHRSPFDGDWRRVEKPEGTHVHCPDCRATVTIEAGTARPGTARR